MGFKNKLAIIVPTKDNPGDLEKLLLSFRSQTARPDQLLIVDGSDNDIRYVVDKFSDLDIDYLRVRPPGLTKQRNEGINNVRPEITLVGFLDDDIVLEDEAIKKMLEFWETAGADVAGASFNIVNNLKSSANLYNRFFGINNGKQGAITGSGFNTVLNPVLHDTEVEWLCGGATVWRKETVDRNKYDEWFVACSYIEDIDYSYRAGKDKRLMVTAAAKLWHNVSPIADSKYYQLSRSMVINRYYFVKKHKEFSSLLFFWAVTGQIIRDFFYGLFFFKRTRVSSSLGALEAVRSILTGKLNSESRRYFK